MISRVRFDVTVRDLEYQQVDGTGRLARVYQPQGEGSFPSLVDVHGGAWVNGDRTNNVGIDQELAARGILVAALDVRQPPEAGYPASICDVNVGIRWLKARAAELHGTARVGAFGNSSGGHQVVLAGLRPRDARYAAQAQAQADYADLDATLAYVIAAWPVIDPLYRYRFAQKENREQQVVAHQRYWGTEEAMAEGNPQTIMDSGEDVDLPPILYMLKADDKNHPLEMQERFIAAYRQRGGVLESQTFEGLPEHGMVPSPSQPETLRAMDTIEEFIRRQAGE